MRWAKVVLIAVGALIAFIVIESVFRLLQWAIIALVIGVIIAIAVKAHSKYRIAQERRAEVREEKAARKRQVQQKPTGQVLPAQSWTVQDAAVQERAVPEAAPTRRDNVDDELARLKREMGAQ